MTNILVLIVCSLQRIFVENMFQRKIFSGERVFRFAIKLRKADT